MTDDDILGHYLDVATAAWKTGDGADDIAVKFGRRLLELAATRPAGLSASSALAIGQIRQLRRLAEPIATEAWSAEDDAVRTLEGTAAAWAALGPDGLGYARRDWIAATGPAELLPLLELLDELLSQPR